MGPIHHHASIIGKNREPYYTITIYPDKSLDDTFIPCDLRRCRNLPSGTSSVTMELPSGIRIHLDNRENPELTFRLIHKLYGHTQFE